MTPRQRAILMHATGLERSKTSYRNIFAATPATMDWATCNSLVNMGLMGGPTRGEGLFGPLEFFHVTPEGYAAIGHPEGEAP